MNEYPIETMLYLAGNLFRVYVIYRFFRLFFERSKYGIGIELAAFMAYFALNSLTFLYFNLSILNLITNLILSFLLTYLYVGKVRMRVFVVIMIYAVNLSCEEIVYRTLIALTGANNLAIGIIAPNLLMLPLVLSLGKLLDLKSGQRVSFVEWICTIFVPILSIFISGIVLAGNQNDRMAVVAAVGLLLMNVIVFYLFDHISSTYQQKYELALQRRQNEAYENQFRLQGEADRQMEIFRHDMKNHLIALRSLAESKDNDSLLIYVNGMDALVQRPDQFVSSGNVAVDSILNVKLQQVKEVGAEISLEINLPEHIPIAPLDLNIILGNLMDNAVCALRSCPVKKLTVSIVYDRNMVYIEVTNTYTGELRRNGKNLLTTKREREGHGIGLQSVKLTAMKYDGTVEIEHSKTFFSVTVMLCGKE